jgi:hypothetical protein
MSRDDLDDALLVERDDRTADEARRSIVEELTPTDDELAHGLERAATRQRPDTAWQPMAPLPKSYEWYASPGRGWWRRRGGITFTIVEVRAGVAAGLMYGGWVSSADGVPLMDGPWLAFPSADAAVNFCDAIDLAVIGDFQI